MKKRAQSAFAVATLSAVVMVDLTFHKGIGSHANAATPLAAATQTASGPASTVKIDNFVFAPRELTVAVGTKVTWQNSDDVPHTATSTSDPQAFDSGPLDTDDKYSFTFTKAGTYPYYCKVHPHMKGTVIVK